MNPPKLPVVASQVAFRLQVGNSSSDELMVPGFVQERLLSFSFGDQRQAQRRERPTQNRVGSHFADAALQVRVPVVCQRQQLLVRQGAAGNPSYKNGIRQIVAKL